MFDTVHILYIDRVRGGGVKLQPVMSSCKPRSAQGRESYTEQGRYICECTQPPVQGGIVTRNYLKVHLLVYLIPWCRMRLLQECICSLCWTQALIHLLIVVGGSAIVINHRRQSKVTDKRIRQSRELCTDPDPKYTLSGSSIHFISF